MAQAQKAGPARKGFVQAGLRVTTGQLTHFDLAVAGCGLPTRLLLIHLILSARQRLRKKNRSLSVPVPSTFLRDHFRQARIKTLVDRGVLTVSEHDRGTGLCREYEIDSEWLEAFIEAGLTTIADSEAPLFDPVKGIRVRSRRKTRKTTASHHPVTPLVLDAALGITASWFNPEATQAHLEGFRRAIAAARSEEERERLTRQYRNDLWCYQSVLAQQPVPVEGHPTLWVYPPAYTPQSFGRLTEIGGGLQSCSRAMKAAARQGVPDVRNYDLVSSQPNFLVVQMEAAGIDARWLRDYLSCPGGKQVWADRYGMSVQAWKAVLNPALMGARIPSPAQLPYADGDLLRAFRRAVGPEDLQEAYGRFYEDTAGLRESLTQWHDYLAGSWAAETGRYVAVQEKTYVENAVGVRVALEDLSPEGKPYELKARLAAFVLQGMEVAVVHRLVVAAGRWGYSVMSHEHDGLITRGVIPEAAVAEAASEAGVPLWAVNLEKKPFG